MLDSLLDCGIAVQQWNWMLEQLSFSEMETTVLRIWLITQLFLLIITPGHLSKRVIHLYRTVMFKWHKWISTLAKMLKCRYWLRPANLYTNEHDCPGGLEKSSCKISYFAAPKCWSKKTSAPPHVVPVICGWYWFSHYHSYLTEAPSIEWASHFVMVIREPRQHGINENAA